MNKSMKKHLAFVLTICIMLISVIPVSAASMTIAPAVRKDRGTTTMYIGNALTLNSNMHSQNTEWYSQDNKIVYIQNGKKGTSIKVTPKSVGTTYVYAVTKTKTMETTEMFAIVVKKKPAVKISCTSKTMKKGATATISMYNLDSSVSYKIANTKIVKATGIASSINNTTNLSSYSIQLKALKAGKTTLTLTTGEKKYSCTITVK